jgi:protein-S-isoprenylcysteine O-methyltransferase Ste14
MDAELAFRIFIGIAMLLLASESVLRAIDTSKKLGTRCWDGAIFVVMVLCLAWLMFGNAQWVTYSYVRGMVYGAVVMTFGLGQALHYFLRRRAPGWQVGWALAGLVGLSFFFAGLSCMFHAIAVHA